MARAWTRYFAALKAGQPAHPPRFKKKGRSRDSFYIANDKLRVEGKSAVLPKVGRVALAEVPDGVALRRRTGDDVVGIDLGVAVAAALSTGEKIAAPRPLRSALRRLRLRSRRQSRKVQAAKDAAGISGRIPKGMRLPKSAKPDQVRASPRAPA